jgi:hypothetical protein
MTSSRRVYRAVPWRTAPHPWFSFVVFTLIVMSMLVGVVIGIFRYHAPATEPLPSTSYSHTIGATP